MKLLLVDGNSILNRAYYGTHRQMLSAADGTPTAALLSFVNSIERFSSELKPDKFAVAFDLPEPTFRHIRYSEYKAQRSGMPDDLAVQLPLAKEILSAMDISVVSMAGYEADDVIGSYAKQAAAEGFEVQILTGDRDSFQLIDEQITVIYPNFNKQGRAVVIFDKSHFLSEYGLQPRQLIDLKALMGDSSDNIPGVPGVGPKTATRLLQEYGDLDTLYSHLTEIKGSVGKKLADNREMAYLSRELATIVTDLTLPVAISQLGSRQIKREELVELFQKLDFKSLIDRLNLESDLESSGQTKDIIFPKACADWPEFIKLPHQRLALMYANDLCVIISEDLMMFTTEKFTPEMLVDLSSLNCDILTFNYKDFLVINKLPPYLTETIDLQILAYLIDSSECADFSRAYHAATGSLFTPIDNLSACQQLAYLAMLTFNLYEAQISIIEERNQLQLLKEIELPLIPILADMEQCGIKLNRHKASEVNQELKQREDILVEEIHSYAKKNFNLNSPKQLAEFLFDDLQLEPLKKTASGKRSTAAGVLEQLADQHPVIGMIQAYREINKLRSTFVEGLLKVADQEDRVHTSFNQTLTSTGRLSSSNPNLQNIPIRSEHASLIRSMFEADRDHVLIASDYSQIELRLLAHLSADENLCEAFRNDEDIHAETAAGIFAIPQTEVTAQQRSVGKTVNFSIVYGVSAFGLSRNLQINPKQAQNYIDGYNQHFPSVMPYLHSLAEAGSKKGYVETMFGRRRYIPELKSRNFQQREFGKRAAMNMPIQGSAADLLKLAMIEINRQLQERKLKAKILLQVHDELILTAPESELAEVRTILQDTMQNIYPLNVPLKAEVKVGKNWSELK